MKKILVLTAPAGGGHTATAHAIAEAISATYPSGYEVRVVDVFKDMDLPIPLEKFTTPAYNNSVQWFNSYPYKLFFKFASVSAELINQFATTVLGGPALKYLRAYDPDAIISTFPIISYGASTLLRRENWHKNVDIFTIITDAGDVHRLWLLGGNDEILVATPDTVDYAVAKGVPADHVHYFGFPISQQFTHPPKQAAARSALGLALHKLTVLILPLSPVGTGIRPSLGLPGGGDTKVLELAHTLKDQKLGLQYIFITGGNERLKRKLTEIKFQDDVLIQGYISNMATQMAAADLIIGKAGWVSLYEAIVSRRPIIITNVVLGQEEANVEFITTSGVGQLITDPTEAAEEITRIAADPQQLDPYRQALDKLGLDAKGGRRIAKFVHKRLESQAKPASSAQA